MSATVLDVTQAPSNSPNILDNGGMEVWQRGTSFVKSASGNSSTFYYSADRWQTQLASVAGGNSLTGTTSQIAGHDGNFAMQITGTSTGAGNIIEIYEQVEDYVSYQGKTVTVSAWIKTNITGVSIEVTDGLTGTVSAAHPGDGNWHLLSVTKTMSASSTQILVFCAIVTLSAGSYTIAVDSVMMSLGQATSFVPLHYAIDLMRCQRYFIRMGGDGVSSPLGMAQAYSTTQLYGIFQLPVPMRVAPTSVVNNPTGFQGTTSTGGGATLATLVMTNTYGKFQEWAATTSGASFTTGNASSLFAGSTSNSIDLSADF